MRLLLLPLILCASSGAQTVRIPLAELRDRIEGGWAGQMIGVSYGAPTEFRSLGKIIAGDLPKWTPDRVSNSLKQDDLYVDMTFAKVLDDKGLDATTADFGAMFRDAKYPLWHANMAGRRALKRGVPAAESGLPKWNAHANDIDFQIEADFIGLMTPGLLQPAINIAMRAGRVMNYGDGIYGGVYMSCLYAAAFFEKEPRRVVEAGLACLPPASGYARIVRDTLAWHKQYPKDWKRTWQLLTDRYDRDDVCPTGVGMPYNIDATLNGAFVILGLLYGEGDFFQTIDISTRAGQDSDCNPATSGGILGVMLGYKGIPEEWKAGIPAIQNEKFLYTDFTFRTVSDSTLDRALKVIERAGGKREGETVVIRRDRPKPPPLEQFNPGVPRRVAVTDAGWQWKGEWKQSEGKRRNEQPRVIRTASAKGAEAVFTFDGTGVLISGPYLEAGGQADVYLDGRLDRTVDVYSDGPGGRGNESVWHAFGLKPGKHTVRVVVRGEPYGGSKGTDIAIDDTIVFSWNPAP